MDINVEETCSCSYRYSIFCCVHGLSVGVT